MKRNNSQILQHFPSNFSLTFGKTQESPKEKEQRKLIFRKKISRFSSFNKTTKPIRVLSPGLPVTPVSKSPENQIVEKIRQDTFTTQATQGFIKSEDFKSKRPLNKPSPELMSEPAGESQLVFSGLEKSMEILTKLNSFISDCNEAPPKAVPVKKHSPLEYSCLTPRQKESITNEIVCENYKRTCDYKQCFNYVAFSLKQVRQSLEVLKSGQETRQVTIDRQSKLRKKGKANTMTNKKSEAIDKLISDLGIITEEVEESVLSSQLGVSKGEIQEDLEKSQPAKANARAKEPKMQSNDRVLSGNSSWVGKEFTLNEIKSTVRMAKRQLPSSHQTSKEAISRLFTEDPKRRSKGDKPKRLSTVQISTSKISKRVNLANKPKLSISPKPVKPRCINPSRQHTDSSRHTPGDIPRPAKLSKSPADKDSSQEFPSQTGLKEALIICNRNRRPSSGKSISLSKGGKKEGLTINTYMLTGGSESTKRTTEFDSETISTVQNIDSIKSSKRGFPDLTPFTPTKVRVDELIRSKEEEMNTLNSDSSSIIDFSAGDMVNLKSMNGDQRVGGVMSKGAKGGLTRGGKDSESDEKQNGCLIF